MKKLSFLCAATILLLLFACSDEGAKHKEEIIDKEGAVLYYDYKGAKHDIRKSPDRVGFFYNSFLDLWTYLGGEAVFAVSGRKSQKNEGIEEVGSMGGINIERTIELKPELVFASAKMSRHLEYQGILQGIGVNAVYLRYDNYDDFLRISRLFSLLIDNGKSYEERILPIDKEVSRLISSVPKGRGKKFLVLFTTSKSISAETRFGETARMLADIGMTNIVSGIKDENKSRAEIGLEKIVMEAPDFIFIKTMGSSEKTHERLKEKFTANSAWSTVKAVRDGEIHYLPKGLFLYKPNENYPRAYEYLIKICYGE